MSEQGKTMSDEMKIELLPCPFCGAAPKVEMFHEEDYIVCATENCPIESQHVATAEAWNRRAAPPIEPVQPVAWAIYGIDGGLDGLDPTEPAEVICGEVVPLYAHPPRRELPPEPKRWHWTGDLCHYVNGRLIDTLHHPITSSAGSEPVILWKDHIDALRAAGERG